MLYHLFPALISVLQKTHIPRTACEDQKMWDSTTSSSLSMKDAYTFLNPVGSMLSWCSIIWQKCIALSNYLLLWRFIHNKLQTNDDIWIRRCNVDVILH